MTLNEKYENLKNYISSLESLAVAFSSGVDSTFLLKTAHDVLGDNAVAVTAVSCSFPQRELKEAEEFCKKEGIKHIIFKSEELENKDFTQNPPNRCYFCKKQIFKNIIDIAKQNNIKNIAEGSNTDDNGDYRPGLQAVKELNIKSPLRYAELNKNEIRELSKALGLKTYDKQSFACLASRFPYGEEITEEKLLMVDKAEQLLLDMGFHQLRVRIHNKTARIEVEENEFPKLIEKENREKITAEFKKYGFTYISMDLQGYRTGSMNETLKGLSKNE